MAEVKVKHTPKPVFEQEVLEMLVERLRENNRLNTQQTQLTRELLDRVHQLGHAVTVLSNSVTELTKQIGDKKPRRKNGK